MLTRAVLFDLGNTLVSYYPPADFMPVLRRSLAACLLALGRGPLQHDAQTALIHQALELNQERADLAVWPLEERLRVLFGDCALDEPLLGRLCSAFLEPIFATATVNTDALAVLTGLRRLGLKTAVVSNTPWGSPGRVWRAELARYGLLPALDAVVFCTDVGWRKPHPAPFRRALELLDTPAQEAVFVGDDPVWDVEGASSAGIRPILLRTGERQSSPARVTNVSSLPEVLEQISAR